MHHLIRTSLSIWTITFYILNLHTSTVSFNFNAGLLIIVSFVIIKTEQSGWILLQKLSCSFLRISRHVFLIVSIFYKRQVTYSFFFFYILNFVRSLDWTTFHVISKRASFNNYRIKCSTVLNPLPSANFFRTIYQQFIYEIVKESSFRIKWYSTGNNILSSNGILRGILLITSL